MRVKRNQRSGMPIHVARGDGVYSSQLCGEAERETEAGLRHGLRPAWWLCTVR